MEQPNGTAAGEIPKEAGGTSRSGALGRLVAGLAAAFAAGGLVVFVLLESRGISSRPDFHDMRVIRVPDLVSLVAPGDPAVRELARKLGTPEAAYAYVRDRVRYEAMLPALPPGQVIRGGAASCLGKATLLCSLYRAMGIPARNVRVITGDVALSEGTADHAWVDLEYRGNCLQQDPSGFLGLFGFAEFPETSFTRHFIQEETFCFNDEGFAIVSQLNRFRNAPPGETGTTP
jgi:hypothetical protein